MWAHLSCFIIRRFPRTNTRLVSVAVFGAILMVMLAITTGPTLAVEHEGDGTAVQTTIDAGEREQQESLGAEIGANLKAFDQMERAPRLFTRHSGATAWATSAEIKANLVAFDRMERAPELFTKFLKEDRLTHPWGGDALTPDY